MSTVRRAHANRVSTSHWFSRFGSVAHCWFAFFKTLTLWYHSRVQSVQNVLRIMEVAPEAVHEEDSRQIGDQPFDNVPIVNTGDDSIIDDGNVAKNDVEKDSGISGDDFDVRRFADVQSFYMFCFFNILTDGCLFQLQQKVSPSRGVSSSGHQHQQQHQHQHQQQQQLQLQQSGIINERQEMSQMSQLSQNERSSRPSLSSSISPMGHASPPSPQDPPARDGKHSLLQFAVNHFRQSPEWVSLKYFMFSMESRAELDRFASAILGHYMHDSNFPACFATFAISGIATAWIRFFCSLRTNRIATATKQPLRKRLFATPCRYDSILLTQSPWRFTRLLFSILFLCFITPILRLHVL